MRSTPRFVVVLGAPRLPTSSVARVEPAGPQQLTVTEDFFDFGISVTIKLPPPSDVKTVTIPTLPTMTQAPAVWTP